ncbi:hypothetical protein ACLBWX_09810 [Methylobacterium sp. M6A4_1b]
MPNFALRLPDHVMSQAKTAADEDNVSINQLLVAFIAEGLGHRRGLKALQARAGRADVDAALALLDGAPDVPPEPRDRMRLDR